MGARLKATARKLMADDPKLDYTEALRLARNGDPAVEADTRPRDIALSGLDIIAEMWSGAQPVAAHAVRPGDVATGSSGSFVFLDGGMLYSVSGREIVSASELAKAGDLELLRLDGFTAPTVES